MVQKSAIKSKTKNMKLTVKYLVDTGRFTFTEKYDKICRSCLKKFPKCSMEIVGIRGLRDIYFHSL